MLDVLLRILALAHKELLAILKDPRSRVSLFLPPIMQCLIFGYAASYDLNNVPYAVLDQDRTAASRELIARLDGSGIFTRVRELTRAADMRDFINEQRVWLVVQTPADFERRLFWGLPADVQVIADGRNSNTAATATGYVGAAVAAFNVKWLADHGRRGLPVQLVTRAWFNP